MTLELNKVSHQVVQIGEQAAQRAQLHRDTVPDALKHLSTYIADVDLLEKINLAIKSGWTGAVPTSEQLDEVDDPPPVFSPLTIVAVDGSQIYPDRHGIALYYAINIGVFILRLGSGETPMAESMPTLYFDDDSLYDEDEFPISAQTINARRTVAELSHLARVAIQESKQQVAIALADGNIALRVKQAGISEREGQRLERDYIKYLSDLRAADIPTGGFISRPGSTSVVKLLQLAHECPPDHVGEFVKNNKSRPYNGITDPELFTALLDLKQRSAVFKQVSQWTKPYEERGHAIHFFYVRVGTLSRSNVVRVEVPEWVAADMNKVRLLHCAIADQCQITDIPYPYALVRADEMAVIKNTEKANLDEMIAIEMMRNGLEPRPSEKAATKTMARYGKRR